MDDGRSKVSRPARTIEKELEREYGRWRSPLQERRAPRAAELMTVGDMTGATMGSDPKSTRRGVAPPRRRSKARTRADGLPELNPLVIRYFFSELEAALRHAFQELLGYPLPLKFTLELENAPRGRRLNAGSSAQAEKQAR